MYIMLYTTLVNLSQIFVNLILQQLTILLNY